MSAKILVVDDELPIERLICQQFRKKIHAKELEFVFAHNGVEALNRLQTDPEVDMVLTDLNMPEMDGLTLLEKLKAFEPKLKTVVVTAYSDLSNIRKAMNLDAFDFLTKPIDFKDLEVTINRTLECVQQIKENQHQIQQIQTQLIQTEKMSSLGQLVAGVAHEINNPVNFIAGNLSYAQEYIQDLIHLVDVYQKSYPSPLPEVQTELDAIELDYLLEDLPKLISSMNLGIERIHQISVALRSFSRSDTTKKILFNLHEGLESTLLILRHRLKANGGRPAIDVIRNYGNLPQVECYPGPLNQVFMNILANGIDALEEAIAQEMIQGKPTLTIHTELVAEDRVSIRISDNGIGMTPEIKQRLFDSMFTTKPTGKGTGLGLSISHQIITKKHGGELTCTSEIQKGTEFKIEIPLH